MVIAEASMADMYLDIPASENLDAPTMATFRETGPATAVRCLRLWREEAWRWCAVTGWDEGGPAPARIQMIEESGDGPARLVHGGPLGLRLAEIPGPDAAVAWDLADARQWGEPFLIIRPEAEWR